MLYGFESQRAYRDALARFRLYFVTDGTNPLVRNVKSGDCEAYLSWRRWHAPDGEKLKKPLSGYTLKKDRSVLHRLFEKAVTWGHRDGNRVSRTETPKVDERDPVILDADQYEKLLEAAEASKNPFTYMYALHGARKRVGGPVAPVLEGGFLRVRSGRDGHRTKSGEGRWVPLPPRLREALREHAARYRMQTYDGERSPWVFHHEFAFKKTKPGDRIESMRKAFANAAERAKLPSDFRKHDLRHRRVTTWLSEGHSPVKVQKAMGHSDLKTTMGYYTFVRSDLQSLVEPEQRARKGTGDATKLGGIRSRGVRSNKTHRTHVALLGIAQNCRRTDPIVRPPTLLPAS